MSKAQYTCLTLPVIAPPLPHVDGVCSKKVGLVVVRPLAYERAICWVVERDERGTPSSRYDGFAAACPDQKAMGVFDSASLESLESGSTLERETEHT